MVFVIRTLITPKACISSATCCGISSTRSVVYHHCESDTTCGWWYAPTAMIYTLKRDDIPLLSQWIKKNLSWNSSTEVFLGGGSGIRTHVGVSPNGFQDRLVMTTSISLRVTRGEDWDVARLPKANESTSQHSPRGEISLHYCDSYILSQRRGFVKSFLSLCKILFYVLSLGAKTAGVRDVCR